ncbi:MarR family winged helix-turn-helix transcriptional regulator [Novosphingobium nitrogenifigens]|nr:MarR family transcriptional regulator [Novosphingobium nitrogenifigens]
MTGTNSRLLDFLPYRLAVTSNAVSGMIADEYRERFGLKISEWRVMAILSDCGPLTQRELVQCTVTDKVTVNRACKALEERGFLRRSPNRADGRSHHLELTEEGREICEQIWPRVYDAYDRVFAALTPRETDRLRDLLDKLRESVRGERNEKAQRVR